jgi:hypothetical protein
MVEIRCGASRFRPLGDLRLVGAEVPPGLTLSEALTVDALPGSLPAYLDGQALERGMGVMAGTALTYDLGGAYRIFHARIGVPDAVAASAAVRFVVLVDGKLAYRGPPVSSSDTAQEIGIPVSGAATLTLRAENAGPADAAPLALWAQPVLVRP